MLRNLITARKFGMLGTGGQAPKAFLWRFATKFSCLSKAYVDTLDIDPEDASMTEVMMTAPTH